MAVDNGRGRVDITPDNFNRLIGRHGYRLMHYRAMPCFCRNPSTGQPDPNCDYCDSGVYYFGEHEIKGICTGINADKTFEQSGAMMFGTMSLTVEAATKLAYFDRVIHIDSQVPFSEFLTRSTNPSGDKLRFRALAVDKVLGAGAVEYVENVDFRVNGRFIVWEEDKGPEVEAPLSICYMTRPTWLVVSHAHLIRDTLVKFKHPRETPFQLPLQATCRLEWLVSQSEISG